MGTLRRLFCLVLDRAVLYVSGKLHLQCAIVVWGRGNFFEHGGSFVLWKEVVVFLEFFPTMVSSSWTVNSQKFRNSKIVQSRVRSKKP